MVRKGSSECQEESWAFWTDDTGGGRLIDGWILKEGCGTLKDYSKSLDKDVVQSLHFTKTSSVLKRCVQVLPSKGIRIPVSYARSPA